ncbi:hypothetical protein [Roseicella frigidaeris]|uniref:Uncharacterized protein n=1 Tax=Roseicella frigidaeris TaxID=2230885 RepID=A0A327M615_9PROT|nr:hypothetical protein [Roseicella frigidaeris]RAI58741.1 hypothetical protein DOO78_11685 [Roseicella frigidaeris]
MVTRRHPTPPRPSPRRRPLLAAALLPALLAGCAGVGPQRLDMDQMGYAEALGEGTKRQMLLNMVRMRYGDVPTFLSVSQLISGYQLQSTGQLGLNAYPNAAPGNYATVGGTVQYTTRPTFTFTPVTGERFAQSYLRPLAPAELLSLAQSGAPVDLIFRLGVQSVNGMPNAATSGGQSQDASGGFLALMQAMRQVQASGNLGLRFDLRPGGRRVILLLDAEKGPGADAMRQMRRLLGVPPGSRELEVVYGGQRRAPGQLAVQTRSMLQILNELGAQVDVAEQDVKRGETGAALPGERIIRVLQGSKVPADAYAAVPYRDRWFWIPAGDYASKAVFTFAYVLQVLAESGQGAPTPVVTIPGQ